MNCVLFAKWIKFLVRKTKHLKNTGKWKKILEKSGNFVSLEMWEPCFTLSCILPMRNEFFRGGGQTLSFQSPKFVILGGAGKKYILKSEAFQGV